MTRYEFRWANGKNNSAHKVVYEENFGPVPDGFHIHHKDGNRWNNDPSNLEALPGLEHRRLHAQNYHRNDSGEWVKLCRWCGELKPLSEFHAKTTDAGNRSTKSVCKPCRNAENRKRYANGLVRQ